MPEFSCPWSAECTRLSQAELDYDRLFNLSLDLLCVAGLDGYFKRVNPSWTRTLGWSQEELLSRPVESFMHPEDRERTLRARSELAHGVPVRGLENRYLCKDGSLRWLSWQSVVEPSDGTVFAVARDVTEQRQRDHEHLVLSKLESTGILAGGIAHDFNNLLAGLLLNLEMVSLCDATTAQQEQYLAQARQTVNAAKSLTHQLVTFSGGGSSTRQVVQLGRLLQESLELVLRGSALHGTCEVAPDLWPVEVDVDQIGDVVRSLILNAREASPAGGPVHVRARNVVLDALPGNAQAAGDQVCVSVTDAGAGIAPDILPNIFDPYFSTKQRGVQKGMGLGLTICRTVIRQHGGSIAIESGAGRGTTVTFHLPAKRASLAAPPPAVAPVGGRSRRLLVMDDEPTFREILAVTLRQLGYEVETACEGGEAVTRYLRAREAGTPFSIVLLDLTVRGGMGGTETIRVLQSHDPAVTAVLMTGHSNEDTFRHPERHGFKASLGKPFSAQTLRTLLAELVTSEPAGRD